ncbi:MAG: hypothetical protein KKA81_07435 [Bacteroidetes bacterium]|nr:hypothetical protein [Bacteroidota bacterium]
MKKIIILTFLALGLPAFMSGQSRKERKAMYDSKYNYEVQSLGVGQDGTKLLKIWGYGKKPDDALFEAKKNAVAAVIFKGIPAGNGAAQTPAILGVDGYEKNMDFFDEFFKAGGMYLSFVNSTTDGIPGGSDRIKMKKGYKVGLSASVNYNALRKYLEEQGIAKKMDAGF